MVMTIRVMGTVSTTAPPNPAPAIAMRLLFLMMTPGAVESNTPVVFVLNWVVEETVVTATVVINSVVIASVVIGMSV